MSEAVRIVKASDGEVRRIYIEGVLCREWSRSHETLPQAMVNAFRTYRRHRHTTPSEEVVCLNKARTN